MTPSTVISRLPSEIHSSAHQVKYASSLLGEYEVRIYRGVLGPVVILEAGRGSPVPLEYLSELAVRQFVETLPVAKSRFFERHLISNREVWVEVGFQRSSGGDNEFIRTPCSPSAVTDAVNAEVPEVDEVRLGAGRIAQAYSAKR